MINIKPTYIPLRIAEGCGKDAVDLYFNYARFKALANINKESYEAVKKLLDSGESDIETAEIAAYGCYLMAQMGDRFMINWEETLSKDEFDTVMESPQEIMEALTNLFKKKRAASPEHSGKEPAAGKAE